MKLSRPFSRRRGFGLLEVIVVFALVIGAAAVVFTTFTSSNGSAEAANQAESMGAVIGNIQSLYPHHDFSNLNAAVAANPKAFFPASMIDASGTPHNAWGPILVFPYYLNAHQFDINFNKVPAESCAKFITALASGHPDDLKVAGSGADDVGGTVLKADGSGKLDMDQVNYWCSGEHTRSPSVGVDIIGH